MNTELVMTKDFIAMKQKVEMAQQSGYQSKELSPTSYEMQCHALNTRVSTFSISDQEIQVDVNGLEPDDKFVEWLMKA